MAGEVNNQTDIASDVIEIQHLASTNEHAITADGTNVLFTGLFPQQANASIVQMNASDLENFMHGTVCQREDGE